MNISKTYQQNTSQDSLRNFAFKLCNQKPSKTITDDETARVLDWLINAVNMKSLKTWHGDYCNLTHPFQATRKIAHEIMMKIEDLNAFTLRALDGLIGKGIPDFNTAKEIERAKQGWYALCEEAYKEKNIFGFYRVWPESVKNAVMESKSLPAKNNSDAELLEKIHKLIKKVKPEMGIIYDKMKKDVGFSGYVTDLEEKLKNKAKEVFRQQPSRFKIIREEYLNDNQIYVVNPGHSRRDLIGKLLKNIVEENIGEVFAGQKLYKYYKDIK